LQLTKPKCAAGANSASLSSAPSIAAIGSTLGCRQKYNRSLLHRVFWCSNLSGRLELANVIRRGQRGVDQSSPTNIVCPVDRRLTTLPAYGYVE